MCVIETHVHCVKSNGNGSDGNTHSNEFTQNFIFNPKTAAAIFTLCRGLKKFRRHVVYIQQFATKTKTITTENYIHIYITSKCFHHQREYEKKKKAKKSAATAAAKDIPTFDCNTPNIDFEIAETESNRENGDGDGCRRRQRKGPKLLKMYDRTDVNTLAKRLLREWVEWTEVKLCYCCCPSLSHIHNHHHHHTIIIITFTAASFVKLCMYVCMCIWVCACVMEVQN